MSDNHRRYRAIHEALTQCYPGEISGRMAQHLTVLAAFISGIVGSKSSQLPSYCHENRGSSPARKSGQTPESVAEERRGQGGNLFLTQCRNAFAVLGLRDLGVGHGWKRVGSWM